MKVREKKYGKEFLKIVILLMVVVIVSSCREKETYPDEPVITFKSFEKIPTTSGVDKKGKLTLTFTDGDGNIGLSDTDTLPPFDVGSEYYYNFYIYYYEKQNDSFVEITPPSAFHSRIPYVDADLATEGYKGELEIIIDFNNENSIYDTIRFETFIIDRDLNKSNRVVTPEIIVKKSI